MAATIIRFGDEQRVNTYTEDAQQESSVTALADGGWLVTWLSQGQDGNNSGVYQQRYDRNGNAVGKETMVNTETRGFNISASVTGLTDGGWIVTWYSDWTRTILQQRYDSDGNTVGPETPLNTRTDFRPSSPVVTALADGEWLITWVSGDDSGFGVFQQRFDKNGLEIGPETQVNTTTDFSQYQPSVTALKYGGWLVTWVSIDEGGFRASIYQQRFDENGLAVGPETKASTFVTGVQEYPSVTALADGGWIVTWTSLDQDGFGYGISQQRYNADGTPKGGEQRVNTETAGHQREPSVTALADGGWIVTWTSMNQDESTSGVYQQRYDKGGNAVGGELLVNVHTIDDQVQPSVTGLADGGWLTTWTSVGQDGSSYGIYQRRYISVAAFGEGQEHGTGTDGDDVFQVRNGGLSAGDSLEAGGGIDILQMIEAGTLDLTAPDLLTGIEIVQGSSGNDIILADEARLAAIVGFRGGSGTDALHLKAGHYDFTTKLASSLEAITLLGAGSIAFADKATALLANSQTKDGAVILTGDSFSLAERTQLYHQGIRQVTDAGGGHVLAPVDASLSRNAVQENAGKGTVVGTLSGVDPNPGDGLSFQLVDNAGGRFALSGAKLIVANGALLDFEKTKAHTIVVRIADEGGIVTDKSFTITVDDIPVEILKGSSRGDVLKGGTGRDVLYGGLGKDTLSGDKGQDAFAFNTKPNKSTNLDKITDFVVKDDSIWLDNKVFTKLGKAGSAAKPFALNKSCFTTDKAKDKNDYLIYSKKTGYLSYDADGSGSKYKAVEIALLKKGLALKASDFFVI